MIEQQANRLRSLHEDVQDAAVAAEQARARLKKASIAFAEYVSDLESGEGEKNG